MAYTDIDKPSDYFVTNLHTGNGGTQDITGVGFAPNWIWIKNITSAEGSGVFDTVRGVTKMLCSQNSDGESTTANSLTAFGSDGFSVGANNRVNQNTNNIVSWNWKAETSFTNDASGTGIGSIDSAGSANTDAGFSIVSYTGTGSDGTIKHGLSQKPSMIITKDRGNAEHWACYHKSLPAGYNIYLNLNNAQDDNDTIYTTTAPTSSVYSIGTNNRTNGSSRNYIAYCFAEKQGYSKFGSYIGNGNADGTFIYTGFKPAFLIIKRTSAVDTWHLVDNKRDPHNMVEQNTSPDTNAADNANAVDFDFLSNGFKLRNTDNNGNNSGDTYIYMVFAENPFTTSTGVPATAR
jgi:hypothetical protein